MRKGLAQEVRKTFVTAYSRKVDRSDAPRWIAAERRVDRACDAEWQAANAILAVAPRTLRGVIALLTSAADFADARGLGSMIRMIGHRGFTECSPVPWHPPICSGNNHEAGAGL